MVTDISETKKYLQIIESSSLAQAVVQQANDCIIICDTQGIILQTSNIFHRYSASRTTSMKLEEVLPLQYSVFTLGKKKFFSCADVLVGRRVVNETVTLTKKSQETVHFILNAQPLRDKQQKVIGCLVMLTDITAQKQTEAKLRDSEKRLATFFQASPAGIFITRLADGLFIEVNEEFLRMIGYSSGEVIDKTSADLHIWPDFVDRERIVKDIYRQGRVDGLEIQLQHKSGKITDFILSALPLEISGEPCILGAMTDISERKQADRALERMRMLLSEGQRIAHVGSWEYIAETQATIWSEEEYRIYGIDPAGQSPVYQDMLRNNIHPDDAALLDQTFRQALRDRSIFELEHRVVRPDGSIRVLYDIARPYLDDNDRLIKYIGATLDITERKRDENKIQLQNALLQGINRIFEAALTAPTEASLGQVCLDVAAEITGSSFGFIGEIKEDGLYDIAISNPGWDACKLTDESGHRRPPGIFTMHGIYGRVIQDARGFYTNDPGSHPDRVGFPPGHPPLESFLGVPLLREGRAIGMVAVGNREGGYSPEQLEALESLAPAIEEAFSRKQAEQALQEFSLQRELALEGGNLGTWDYDLKKGTVFWDDRFKSIFGVTSEHLEYAQVISCMHPDDQQRVDSAVRMAIDPARDAGYDIEYRVVWPDGSIRWVNAKGRAHFEGDGPERHAVRFVGTVMDVTARKAIEQALCESEERLRLAQVSANVGVWDWNPLTGTTVFTPELYRLYGTTPGSVQVYDDFRRLVHPDDIAKIEADRDEAITGRQPFDLEFRIVQSSGEIRWLSAKGGAVYNEAGEVIRIFGVNIDITQRKLAEEALQESEERYKELVENANSMIFKVDTKGNITYVNEYSEKFFGYKREELLGKNVIGTITPKSETSGRDLEKAVEKICEDPDKFSLHINENIKRNGDRVWIAWSNKALFDKDGNRIGHMAIGTDITERKQIEEGLRRAKDELELRVQERTADLVKSNKELQESKGRLAFLSSQLLVVQEEERKRISREVHDVITSSLGAILLSQKNTINKLDKDDSEAAKDAIERAIAMTQDVMRESRRIINDLRPPMLDDLGLITTFSWLSRQFVSVYPHIVLNTEILVTEADVPQELKIVIFRITQEAFTNIGKYSKAQSALLTLKKAKNRLVLCITDNGIGFDVHDTLAKRDAEQGLGLHSMRERAELSGGTLTIESTVGKGTTIHATWM